MTDMLLSLGSNATARRMIGRLGLPLPLPEPLKREHREWALQPLFDHKIGFLATEASGFFHDMIGSLGKLGADVFLADCPLVPKAASVLEPSSRRAFSFEALSARFAGQKHVLHSLVLDVSSVKDMSSLACLYAWKDVFTKLARSAHVLLISSTSADWTSAEEAAVQSALLGFVKSLAKELGSRGIPVNLLRAPMGLGPRWLPYLAYFLSPRSAFVTGQEIVLGAPVAPMSAVPFRQRALEGKVALVTGAARGIGRATSLVLAREGAKVLCLDRASENEALASLAHQIRGAVLAVDLLDTDAPEQVHKVIRSFGALDIVVHNAGITRDKTFLRMSQEQWDSVLNVNLGAALRLHQATLPLLRTNSRIVALSSIAGIAGNAGQTAYAASKAALAGWVRGLSQGDLPVGTTANAIAPGFIETRLTAAIPVAIREVARRLSALGQGGLPEDIAEAILFFARPDTDCLHGHTLRVCGGAFVGA